MYNIGDVVFHEGLDVKMTVKSYNSFDDNVATIFYYDGEFREASFPKKYLVLYSKYIREKKLQSLIDGSTEQTINEI